MTAQKSSHATLRGILECPIRRGYIDFEYTSGDKVGELRKRVAEVWGPPEVGLDKRALRRADLWAEAWAILCEDSEGTFIPLRDEDKIPEQPPLPLKSDRPYRSPGNTTRSIQEYVGEDGVVHDRDCFYYEASVPINLERTYEVPSNVEYSVRLLALVALSGG